jgi:hypothetical protein
MNNPKRKTPVSIVFSHLSDGERIDKACELLAVGVLRLLAKERDQNTNKENEIQKKESVEDKALHTNEEKIKTEVAR